MPSATTADSFQKFVGFLGPLFPTHTAPIDIEGHLLAEEEVDRVFLNAPRIKCFRWRDSSFVIDPHVETVQDVFVSSKVKLLCVALDGA